MGHNSIIGQIDIHRIGWLYVIQNSDTFFKNSVFNGHAGAELTFDDVDDWKRHNGYVNVELTGVENEYSYFNEYIPVFYRDVMLVLGDFPELPCRLQSLP